jgi:hypothetical protein
VLPNDDGILAEAEIIARATPIQAKSCGKRTDSLLSRQAYRLERWVFINPLDVMERYRAVLGAKQVDILVIDCLDPAFNV